jgi:hypothetical protein
VDGQKNLVHENMEQPHVSTGVITQSRQHRERDGDRDRDRDRDMNADRDRDRHKEN